MGAPNATVDPASRKRMGAFYTPPAMAEALVRWAVRAASDHILDPSFGGMVFLQAARRRLLLLGAAPDDAAAQIHGLELDSAAHHAATQGDGEIPAERLLLGDFFSIGPGRPVPKCQAVVGNPPYIRYQEFKRSSQAAHQIAETAGVRLTRRASSWAPFLIHATAFVAAGGRMAQVLPAELLHAQYASEVLEFVRRRFERVTIAVFDERVFPGALEEVVLLFADDRGEERAAEVELVPCRTFNDLDLAAIGTRSLAPNPQETSNTVAREKLLVQLLPAETQSLYREVAGANEVSRLGRLADVDIGAVTGANDFFLMSERDASGLAPELLRHAVSKAAQIRGARYRREDHQRLVAMGRKASLFIANEETPAALMKTAASYLERGRKANVHRRYKCRTRAPWWAVPMPTIGTPDLLLTYCANKHPRLSLNEARVVQTNTIHGVAVRNGHRIAPALAATFYNSLTLLSTELVGRSYGGGVLKLEPTEAEAILLPPLITDCAEHLPLVDELVRSGDPDVVLNHVDRVVLADGLGLSGTQIQALRDGAQRLRARRQARGKRPRTG